MTQPDVLGVVIIVAAIAPAIYFLTAPRERRWWLRWLLAWPTATLIGFMFAPAWSGNASLVPVTVGVGGIAAALFSGHRGVPLVFVAGLQACLLWAILMLRLPTPGTGLVTNRHVGYVHGGSPNGELRWCQLHLADVVPGRVLPAGWIDQLGYRRYDRNKPLFIAHFKSLWHTPLTGIYRRWKEPAGIWCPGGLAQDAAKRLQLLPRTGNGPSIRLPSNLRLVRRK
jgi:hypothetical protein